MMKKIETFNEVLNNLSHKEIVTLANGNYFVMKGEKILSYFKGNRIVMTVQDFIDLYSRCDFIEYEDDKVVIDSLKDSEYYSFKHK